MELTVSVKYMDVSKAYICMQISTYLCMHIFMYVYLLSMRFGRKMIAPWVTEDPTESPTGLNLPDMLSFLVWLTRERKDTATALLPFDDD